MYLTGLCVDSSIAQLAAIYVDGRTQNHTSVWKHNVTFLIERLLGNIINDCTLTPEGLLRFLLLCFENLAGNQFDCGYGLFFRSSVCLRCETAVV